MQRSNTRAAHKRAFIVRQGLALQGFQPCGTIQLFRILYGQAAGGDGVFDGIARSRAGIQHTFDCLTLFESCIFLIQFAQFLFQRVNVGVLVIGKQLADFSLARGDFGASFLNVHVLPP